MFGQRLMQKSGLIDSVINVINVLTDTINFLFQIELHVHHAFIIIVLSASFNAQLRVRVRVERDRHGPAGSIEYRRWCAAEFET